jgi:hypothetical protein
MAVLTSPGHTALTVMLALATSKANACVKPMIPNFDAQ